MDIVDIPIPNLSSSTATTTKNATIDPTVKVPSNSASMSSNDGKVLSLSDSLTEGGRNAVAVNNVSLSMVKNSDAMTKVTYTPNFAKSKSLTKLPMPPGVNVSELTDAKTPSPPRNVTPPPLPPMPPKTSSAKVKVAPNSGKKGVLTLPMPPIVGGVDDLSGDDEQTPPRNRQGKGSSKGGASTVRRKRPKILNRRASRTNLINRDWGERSVDVFEVIAQIGEGTYGQVSLFSFYFKFSFKEKIKPQLNCMNSKGDGKY